MGTTKRERKYGKKVDEVIEKKKVKKKRTRESKPKARLRVLKDKSNFVGGYFDTLAKARAYIEKQKELDAKKLLVCDYQIV